MSPGLFLIWPALHLMYGTREFRSYRIDLKRRRSGMAVLLFSLVLVILATSAEHGFFYWLFALMTLALIFVQIRIWNPVSVNVITGLSALGLIISGGLYVI